MKFNNLEELKSYIVKFFESRYNIKCNCDLKDLAGNVATTLYILFNNSFKIPEHKFRLILSLVSLSYTTGKGVELNELMYKYSFINKKENV